MITDILSYSPWLERQGLAETSEPEVTLRMLEAGENAQAKVLVQSANPWHVLDAVYRAMRALEGK